MTTLQTYSPAQLAAERLDNSRQFLLSLLDTLSDVQLTTRVGGVGNHAIWVMGHLAFADDLFVSAFLDEPSSLSKQHVEQFSLGSIPSGNASDYPSREELPSDSDVGSIGTS
jgi:hypothetical protein